jgi:Na+/melibiose symporter-like transporter
MYLLKDGRKNYLDFLRNMTPQALLVFIGVIFAHGGIHGRASGMTTFMGILLLAMAALAAFCNVSVFFDPIREHVKLEKARARQNYEETKASRKTRLKQNVKMWWRLTPLILELAVVMMIIEATCVAAAISGGLSAQNALHLCLGA